MTIHQILIDTILLEILILIAIVSCVIKIHYLQKENNRLWRDLAQLSKSTLNNTKEIKALNEDVADMLKIINSFCDLIKR